MRLRLSLIINDEIFDNQFKTKNIGIWYIWFQYKHVIHIVSDILIYIQMLCHLKTIDTNIITILKWYVVE
jgi:hypothetical protein